jgi:hypothetical protein
MNLNGVSVGDLIVVKEYQYFNGMQGFVLSLVSDPHPENLPSRVGLGNLKPVSSRFSYIKVTNTGENGVYKEGSVVDIPERNLYFVSHTTSTFSHDPPPRLVSCLRRFNLKVVSDAS